jgi:acyl carrier protein
MKRLFTVLSDLLYYAFSSRFEHELLSRPQPDDQAFYKAHYGDSGIPEDIPIRVRKVYVEQLGDCWNGVRPDDNVRDACPEVDLAELLYEIEDEFGIKISDEDMKRMDGTFDAIVRYVVMQRRSTL